MATFTIDLTTTTFYPSSAIGKTHLMNAKHAERIIAARNSKPEFTGDLDNGEELDAHFNSAAYKAYERSYRNALREARVICTQRQTRVYHSPNGTAPVDANNLPADLCVKCASHIR
jgi:hypothetical protein